MFFTRFLIFAAVFISACGDMNNTGENYGNILASPSGITLTEETHKGGWGRTDCLMCHNVNNIHLVDRSGTGIDVAAIRQQTFDEGEASCRGCHGTNGAP